MTGAPRRSTQVDPDSLGAAARFPPPSPSVTPFASMEVAREDDGDDGGEAMDQVDCTRLDAVGANGDGENPPPSKKARYLFSKCFDATFNPRTGVAGADRILAPDSDEEEGT